MHYIGVIHKDKSSCFGISFPDFPGCISAGNSIDEVITSGTEALTLHAAGMIEDEEPFPQPISFDAYESKTEYNQMQGKAQFVQIPLILDSGSNKRVNISIDQGLLIALDQSAQQRKMTRSSLIASAVRKEISSLWR